MLVVWRAHRRRARRAVWVVALTVGLLGGVALASLAGARRTASTFAAYQRDVKLSDLAVATTFTDLKRVRAIAGLPGVESSATYLGLNGYPLVNGKTVQDFRYTGVFGSLDGRFFTQDRATVVSGRLPRLDATDEVALSPSVATRLGASVGDDVRYLFESDENSKTIGRAVFRVVGIVKLPPVIVDENDVIEGAILPPAATKHYLGAFYYAWQGIRLRDGVHGIGKFLDDLRTNPAVNGSPLVTQRYDETRVLAQRSIRPEAVALALFGLAAGIAGLALGGLGISRLIRRWTGERRVLRAIGLTRAQLALLFGFDAVLGVAVGLVIAVIVGVLLSPLWPIGALREIAPDVGLHADLTVLLGAGAALMFALLAMTATLAWRAAGGGSAHGTRARPSVVIASASRNGVPLAGVLGAHFVLDRNDSPQSVPVRATVVAGALATVAVVAALVFGASLQSLVTHPSRYGWTWDRMLISQAGYGALNPKIVEAAIERGHEVTGWSFFDFESVKVNRVTVPALGIDRERGRVEPAVLSGRSVATDREIVLGRNTLDTLGRKVGDRVRVDAGERHATFTIVGTSTFPSIGLGAADHTSLGRGALVTFDALAGLIAPGKACGAADDAPCPHAVVFDVAAGADGEAVVRRIVAANPDGLPGGTYEQPVTRAADIRNYDEMGSVPLALAALLATAAAIAFLLTLVASVRSRRRDLAVLKTLGITKGQVRGTLIAQTLLTAFITLVIGVPFGILAGRVIWVRFAQDIGVVAHPTIPLLEMVAIGGIATLLCVMFALLPAASAANTPPARVLRTE